MKTKDIKYDRTVRFIGRNGYFKQSGIEVTANDNLVILQPTTSRGETGRCSIEIPIENVGAVMNALSQLTGIE
jgi:hypothetical protein